MREAELFSAYYYYYSVFSNRRRLFIRFTSGSELLRATSDLLSFEAIILDFTADFLILMSENICIDNNTY